MQIRFLLGPAGSGKTFRCLAEIRAALRDAPEGPPLLLLAPKQATFQLERQLLADPALSGYTRLQILSFDRLAEFVLGEFPDAPVDFLHEAGRIMVLRALLGRYQSKLKIFHATARLPGFARQLSQLLREFQRQQISPSQIEMLAAQFREQPTLSGKLQDAATLLNAYQDWLGTQHLQDADDALDAAAKRLGGRTHDPVPPGSPNGNGGQHAAPAMRLGGLWLDGFAEMTPQELDLLAALLPLCDRATLAFCVESDAPENDSWLSGWTVVNRTFHQCRQRIAALPECDVEVESLKRDPERSRFTGNAALRDLEKNWARDFSASDARSTQRAEIPAPLAPDLGSAPTRFGIQPSIRLVNCADPEAEAVVAAREILRFVRSGGRFREAAVLLRQWDGYDHSFRRVFLRYGIPFFLDRREPVAHHPLAELTRYALRLAAFGWQHDDWFGALKTGLATRDEAAVDRLENEAIARGWQGEAWAAPISLEDDPDLEKSLNRWLKEVLPPFNRWNETFAENQRRPNAQQLTAAIRELWKQLDVESTLEEWSGIERSPIRTPRSGIHFTVLDQLNQWLDDVNVAFAAEPLPLSEWLPILEAGLANLTVGVIPPALDQVLIGAIDRSRNPELKLVVLPGWNETIFPALPAAGPLLNAAERESLANHQVRLCLDPRRQIGQERYLAYIACTRARERLVITFATQDANGKPLNPSPFFDHVAQLSSVTPETFSGLRDWRESEHASELAPPVLRAQSALEPEPALLSLADLPALEPIVRKRRQFEAASRSLRLAPNAEKLYGRELNSSVSGLEDFAACPFKFFAKRGLRLEERKEFQFDNRDKGSFQHEVLCEFHRRVQSSGRRWRDLSVAEARELVLQIGREQLPGFGGGRFLASGAAKFTGELLIERLGALMAALIEWTPQYGFDTERVELSFGLDPDGLPPWQIELPESRVLRLRGRIDRVDLCRVGDDTYAVVMDYKSAPRALNQTKLFHGLELQLLSYLGVLRHLAEPQKFFGVNRLLPAGVFYVPLNGNPGRGKAQSRSDILAGGAVARRAAYQHSGRFLADVLEHFDNRGTSKGDQFKFSKRKNSGELTQKGNDAMPAGEFEALRQKIEGHLREYGRRIFEGELLVAPFRFGKETACDRCEFRAGCRFDPWTQTYRDLHSASRARRESSADEPRT